MQFPFFVKKLGLQKDGFYGQKNFFLWGNKVGNPKQDVLYMIVVYLSQKPFKDSL